MSALKFVGNIAPGRARQSVAEIEANLAELQKRPGEWAELPKRSRIGVFRHDWLLVYKRRGAETTCRQVPETQERAYFVRWPESNGA